MLSRHTLAAATAAEDTLAAATAAAPMVEVSTAVAAAPMVARAASAVLAEAHLEAATLQQADPVEAAVSAVVHPRDFPAAVASAGREVSPAVPDLSRLRRIASSAQTARPAARSAA
ncbi:MAG TPA: hypothetical protein VJX29_11495 [Candidatus Acidoferrales bacterium]|nr:hypothetical protein [Candidatus Acidoferrales bacterium]